MTSISSRQFKDKYKNILKREISDYDVQRLVNFRIIKKIRFKNNFYYQEIQNINNILPTIIEVLNDN